MKHKFKDESYKAKGERIKISAMLVFSFTFSLSTVFTQETIPASGGNVSGSRGSVSYSVGQVAYTTQSGTNGSVSQGVQQPYEILVVTGLEEANNINLICSAYPNPAREFLTLKVEHYDKGNLSYQLFDINGKLLESKKITGNESAITMAQFAAGTYFLKVTDHQKEVKSFKIIKN